MIETWYNQDLQAPVTVQYLDGNVFSQDNLGNLIGVNVFDGGAPASISGTVSANVIRADGATVSVTGSLSGNTCYIILPSTAYAVPGPISIIIKLTGGGSTTTLCAIVANVYQSSTDAVVDPGTVLPSIEQLEQTINSLLATIPADFSEVVFSIGGIDQYATDLIKTVIWESGTLSGGQPASNNARIRSDYIDVSKYDNVVFSVNAGYKYFIAIYDSSKNYLSYIDFKTTSYTMQIDPSWGYIRVVIGNTSDTSASLNYVEQVSAKGTPHVRTGINKTDSELYNFDDIKLYAWSIGYVYDNGGVDRTGQPNYICNVASQRFPFDIFVYPDDGYQIMVRYYEDQTAPVWTVSFTTGAVFVPANTSFIINASKVTPEAVSDLSAYVSHIHFIRADVADNVPAIKKDTLKIAVLGDSISTYTGYSENDPDLQGAYYPTGNVTNVNFTWWKIIADYLHAESISVSAISRSAFYDYGESAYPPMYDDDRITRLGANGDPDIVFVMAGTNDGFISQTEDITYEYDVDTLETLANTTMRGIALTIRKIQERYPAARIVMLIPKAVKLSAMQTGYDNERICKIAEYISKLSEEYGVYKVIDLRKCGINQTNAGSFMTDGSIHPNANGMRYIAQYIISCLNK